MALFSSLLSLIIPRAYAADASFWGVYCTAFGACGEGRTFLMDLAGRVATMVFMLIGGGCVLVIIYAAVRMVGSGIDDSGHTEAKKTITNAVVGLVLAIMAWSIVNYVGRLVTLIAG
ncbi:MAG: hypothetical protein WCG83_05705 [Candidatus Peregrinibacteria bacterium]